MICITILIKCVLTTRCDWGNEGPGSCLVDHSGGEWEGGDTPCLLGGRGGCARHLPAMPLGGQRRREGSLSGVVVGWLAWERLQSGREHTLGPRGTGFQDFSPGVGGAEPRVLGAGACLRRREVSSPQTFTLHSIHHCVVGQRWALPLSGVHTFGEPFNKKCPQLHPSEVYLIFLPSLQPPLPPLPSSHTHMHTLTPQSQKHIHPL